MEGGRVIRCGGCGMLVSRCTGGGFEVVGGAVVEVGFGVHGMRELGSWALNFIFEDVGLALKMGRFVMRGPGDSPSSKALWRAGEPPIDENSLRLDDVASVNPSAAKARRAGTRAWEYVFLP